ncbi:3,4-dihydroxy-2-butanone-4-phosphate synthase [Amycolatopsis rhabdoformis]|uniref:3,4-dihydroxy-2-butanone-4-phosphate synthase n=1 Tax=Amycolatopsis rhabdoformis TaxID=1448059 RepID=A0ABZ1I0L7_9PSEU|nr:3,4-dihydroxy-2-butanone-4-phosphate synthase [Amycolatopsis rhabdoformis]WSE27960.1 3,4-dihydroxy-2-butanone-4-phosphate synthase [Amycolatopsis rhabdoformis]
MSLTADLDVGALTAFGRGEPVLLDDHLVLAAELVTTSSMAFLIRHTSGFACVALPRERLRTLRIPLLPADDADCPPFAVSVDAAEGTTTGISAHDRALTARTLADPSATRTDLIRPGHVVPLLARRDAWGVAEAAVELCRNAGLAEAAVVAAVVDEADPALTGLTRISAVF